MNLAIHLDRGAPASLQDQLFEQLRQMILNGRLKPNSRVIATRFLADQAGVSRTTVLLAYERLISEGYLETRPTVGTFVSPIPPDRTAPALSPDPATAARGAAPPASHAINQAPIEFDFRPSASDGCHLLPQKVWLQTIRTVLLRDGRALARPHPIEGVEPLRHAIVDHLAATRGIVASTEQVIVVSGRSQACALAAHVILKKGDRVVVECPGDLEIVNLLSARGAELLPVPVDAHGLVTDLLPDGPAGAAFVTPARQSPLGGTLPLHRRTALLAWAASNGAKLIEDETDSDLRYHGTTPPPLASLDGDGCVFYTGSFAKTLGAGLALGFIVVPEAFIEPIGSLKAMADSGGSWLEQMVVARLMHEGGYDHHLRRIRKIYLERRDALIEGLGRHFGEPEVLGAEIGTQLTWRLPDAIASADRFCAAASAKGVCIEPIDCDRRPDEGLCSEQHRLVVLGYAGMTPERLKQAVTRLAQAVEN